MMVCYPSFTPIEFWYSDDTYQVTYSIAPKPTVRSCHGIDSTVPRPPQREDSSHAEEKISDILTSVSHENNLNHHFSSCGSCGDECSSGDKKGVCSKAVP